MADYRGGQQHERGETVAPGCPACGGLCLYNGAYFCSECDWSFPTREDPDDPPLSEKTARWGLDAYISLMLGRGEEPSPAWSRLEYWRW